ncbi:MAG: carboxypeptidase-like regulatory domain-containing protein [Thermoplasmata archaeon]
MHKKIVIVATSLVLCLLFAGMYGVMGANERESARVLDLRELKFPSGTVELVNLSFHVIDGKNWTPIAGASITGKRLGDIYYNGTVGNETWYFYGETDGNGNFAVQVIPDTYYIYVYAENYMPESMSITVSDANATFYVEIALDTMPEPDSTVKGRVLDQSDGSPIANATVYAWSGISSNEGFYYPYENTALTDGNGNYELNVHSGILVVHAYAEGYYEYATTVNVPPNTTMQMDIGLLPFKEPEIVSKVQGKVVSEQEPLVGAVVEFVCYSEYYGGIDDFIGNGVVGSETPGYNGSYPGAWRYSGVTDSAGNYAVDVPAGWLSLTVFAEGFYPHYETVFVEANTTLWLNISLEKLPEPDAWITGIVYNEQGQKVKGAYVSAYALLEIVDILPSNGTATTNATYGYYAASTVTDENGKFTLAVPAGQYALYAYHETYGGYNGVVEVEQGTTLSVEIKLTTITNNTVLPGNGTEDSYVISPPKDATVAPKFTGEQEVTLSPGSELRLSISTLFTVPQGKRIMFGVRETKYISAVYNSANGELLLKAPENWQGEEVVTLEATDGITTVIGTILVKILGTSPANIALWFTCGILVAIAVITVFWYRQRNGKQRQKF